MYFFFQEIQRLREENEMLKDRMKNVESQVKEKNEPLNIV